MLVCGALTLSGNQTRPVQGTALDILRGPWVSEVLAISSNVRNTAKKKFCGIAGAGCCILF